MEYIEREAIMRQFADHVRRSNNSDFAKTPTWNQAVQIVEGAPAADVAPVRHGRWLSNGADWVCSECGEEPWWCGVTEDVLPPYCPNCGAKMDSKGGDGDV